VTDTMAVSLDRPFDEVVAEVREALAGQGFGVLTEIDVQATMKAKLDEDMSEFLILGACNPTLAFKGIGIEPTIGVLLPCNVVVRRDGDAVRVETVDPHVLVDYARHEGLTPVADEVATRLRAVLAALGD